jgi:hypothetical protein
MIKRVFVSLSCLAATLVAFNPEELAERLQGKGVGKLVAINDEKPVTEGQDDQGTTVAAGFVTTFTQKFFNDYNSMIMKIFLQKMKHFKLDDNC